MSGGAGSDHSSVEVVGVRLMDVGIGNGGGAGSSVQSSDCVVEGRPIEIDVGAGGGAGSAQDSIVGEVVGRWGCDR